MNVLIKDDGERQRGYAVMYSGWTTNFNNNEIQAMLLIFLQWYVDHIKDNARCTPYLNTENNFVSFKDRANYYHTKIGLVNSLYEVEWILSHNFPLKLGDFSIQRKNSSFHFY